MIYIASVDGGITVGAVQPPPSVSVGIAVHGDLIVFPLRPQLNHERVMLYGTKNGEMLRSVTGLGKPATRICIEAATVSGDLAQGQIGDGFGEVPHYISAHK